MAITTYEDTELKYLLDEKYNEYCKPEFIETDPIQIPKRYSEAYDIEISAFFASILAWGNRKMIISSATKLMKIMGDSPYDFVMNYDSNSFKFVENFKYRTFNSIDLDFFLRSLNNIYSNKGGLESVFSKGYNIENSIKNSIAHFRDEFISVDHQKRSEKHLANVYKGSAAKRINMFLRWMVRTNREGVDFGLWKAINSADLLLPLDVHASNVARYLGLLKRKQTDWKAAEEVTTSLKKFDDTDPVKYDFALFSLGIFEGVKNEK